MEVAPQANGPDFTTRGKEFGNWNNATHDETMPGTKSDLTAEEQSLLDSFRKDSTDDRWNDDAQDTQDRAPSRQSTEEFDYDDYGYTAAMRAAIVELDNMKLDLGYTDEDPPEYDVAERVRQLNEELANEPPPDEDRRRSIKFKDDLVDLVAPPPDYEEDESDTNTSDPPVQAELEQNRAAPDGEEQKPALIEATAGGDNSQSNPPAVTKTNSPNSPDPQSSSDGQGNRPALDNGNGDGEVRTSLDNGYSSGEDADKDYEEDFEEPDTPTPTPPADISSRLKQPNSPRSSKSKTKKTRTSRPKQTKNIKTSAAMTSKTSPRTKHYDDEKVLIERDGKFELVSVAELKAQGLYPMPELADEVEGGDADPKGADEGEKVLIERNGKFEMVSKSELRAQGLLLDEDDDILEDINKPSQSHHPNGLAPKPPSKPRPATAAQPRHHAKMAERRSQSARPRNDPGVIDNFTYTSPYALTAEEKAEMRRQHRKEMDEDKKQKEVKDKEDEERRRVNNDCFQYWLQQKKQDAQRRHKGEQQQKQDEKGEDKQKLSKQSHDGSSSSINSQSQHSQACGSAFDEWLKTKRKQRHREHHVEQQRVKEEQGHWNVRPRQECDKAFKQWVKKKRRDARQEQNEAKNKQRINKLMVRRTRKAMALARALRQSQSFRYVDYYGYRF